MWLCSRGSWVESAEKGPFKEFRARSGVGVGMEVTVALPVSQNCCGNSIFQIAVFTWFMYLTLLKLEAAESGSESALGDWRVCSQPNRRGMTDNNLQRW